MLQHMHAVTHHPPPPQRSCRIFLENLLRFLPCDPFYFLGQKIFFSRIFRKNVEFFFSMKLTVKNFRNFSSMNLAVKSFWNFVTMNSLKNNFQKIFTVNFIVKRIRRFFGKLKKSIFPQKQKRVIGKEEAPRK